MIKVGVTGGIGSGKSLVCRIFESMGYPVYHADWEARKLTDTHPVIISKISELFGNHIYINEKLDRKKVGQLVFGNPKLLNQLNSIIHPIVEEDFRIWCKKNNEIPIVFQEAAILFESGAYKLVDKVIAVWAPEDLRIKRVATRDGLQVDEIRKRMKHQLEDNQIISKSDYIIKNDENEMLIPQIINIIDELKKVQIKYCSDIN